MSLTNHVFSGLLLVYYYRALDVLIVMTGLLIFAGLLSLLYNPEQDDDVEEDKSIGKAAMAAAEAKHVKQLSEFHSFRRQYMVVYVIIMLADWMQGTHMYTLYLSYGVNISALFLTGFLSGAIFAPFLGSFVDKFGRKRSCIVYCVLEIIINVLEHFHSFPILITGRILGGVSTNLLFSAFESWMTTEHRKRGFPEEWLSRTYSQCSVGNGTMAIMAGIVAQFLEDWLGQIGPFQGAVALTVLALLLILGWEENYGEEHAGDHESSSLMKTFTEGWAKTISDSRVWRIGLTQALSEGAMYTFVFMWVPTLLSLDPPGGVPTGCVFSALMMSIMIGGILYPLLQAFVTKFLVKKESSSELCASIVYLMASLSMAVPVVCVSTVLSPAPYCQELILGSFLVVELCVGLFMPVAGTLRSKYVPDSLQGAILNIFRLPLNAIVVSGTYATDHLEASLVFKLVSGCFFFAALLQATMIPQTKEVTTSKKVD
jgi:MFS transporter, MFS domain-containing protein family, molybdate-anion transporter